MKFIDFIRTCQVNSIYASGETLQSIRFEDNDFHMKAIYEHMPVQIRYQEEGFIHFITKKPVTVNVGWIMLDTVGAINRIQVSETLGLPITYKETNEVLSERASEILEKDGVIERVR